MEKKDKSCCLFPTLGTHWEILDSFSKNKLSLTRLVDVFSPNVSRELQKSLALDSAFLKELAIKNSLDFCYNLIKNFKDVDGAEDVANNLSFFLNKDLSDYRDHHIFVVSKDGRQEIVSI